MLGAYYIIRVTFQTEIMAVGLGVRQAPDLILRDEEVATWEKTLVIKSPTTALNAETSF